MSRCNVDLTWQGGDGWHDIHQQLTHAHKHFTSRCGSVSLLSRQGEQNRFVSHSQHAWKEQTLCSHSGECGIRKTYYTTCTTQGSCLELSNKKKLSYVCNVMLWCKIPLLERDRLSTSALQLCPWIRLMMDDMICVQTDVPTQCWDVVVTIRNALAK